MNKVCILNDNEIFTTISNKFSFYVLFSFILKELTKKNYRNIILYVLKNIYDYDIIYDTKF